MTIADGFGHETARRGAGEVGSTLRNGVRDFDLLMASVSLPNNRWHAQAVRFQPSLLIQGRNIALSAWSSTAITPDRHPVVRRGIVTAEKWCSVPIGECTWDNGAHVHERGFSMCTDVFL